MSNSLPVVLTDGISLLPDPLGLGTFLRFTAPEPVARHTFAIGEVPDIARFTCCHRYEPFWMTTKAGMKIGQTPIETQYLLAERTDGSVVLFVPLVDGILRASLQGAGENGLELVVESGDPAARQATLTGLFVATGDDPFELLPRAAKSVAAYLGTGRLRTDKPLPDFADQFGWCTWDAFYQDVSHDRVREGLESFQAIGVTPRYLILDDGWQSEKAIETKERRLTAFAANEKFPGDLAPTVRMSKEEFGIETFLVWHAMTGYWGGVDGEALPGYGTVMIARDPSEGIRHHEPKVHTYWGPTIGLVPPTHIYRFFQDYHRHLRKQGVDGVKVDTQASLEMVARGLGCGGRVPLMQAYHEALEGSVAVHFEGRLINCMSNANEMQYCTLASSLTRTSTDFWPNRPESHGLHLYVNAQVSAWFGEFNHPDWDMFQSGHAMGPYHAAGRAVSGSPVYVSDKPDQHNAEVLKKLVTPNGSVLRFDSPGLPTRDCLFADPTREPVLLKIWNRFFWDSTRAVVGVFNARYTVEGTEPITGSISPGDVPGLEGERFAVYAHNSKELHVLKQGERLELSLAQLDHELFNLAPIYDGFAAIGNPDYFNSILTVDARMESLESLETVDTDLPEEIEVVVRQGGSFVAYCERLPQAVTVDGVSVPFTYDAPIRKLLVTLPDLEAEEFQWMTVTF